MALGIKPTQLIAPAMPKRSSGSCANTPIGEDGMGTVLAQPLTSALSTCNDQAHHKGMVPRLIAPDADFVLYVDEAGDPGLKAIAPHDAKGASEWFVLGAVLLRAKYEPDTVSWVKAIRKDINAIQGDSLHFRSLSATKRLRACDLVSGLPVKAFAVASHKLNMKSYYNARAASRMSAPDWFYNWCLRLMLERVTAAVQASCERNGHPVRPIRIVLAERGGHAYGQMAVYLDHLRQQAKHGTSILKRRVIVPEAIDWRLIDRIQANRSAGAQLADVVASAFFSALRRPSTDAAIEPARRLRPIMATENRRVDDFGLVLQPPAYEVEIDAIFKDIFRYYGHVL